jgi:hypothetical protein
MALIAYEGCSLGLQKRYLIKIRRCKMLEALKASASPQKTFNHGDKQAALPCAAQCSKGAKPGTVFPRMRDAATSG